MMTSPIPMQIMHGDRFILFTGRLEDKGISVSTKRKKHKTKTSKQINKKVMHNLGMKSYPVKVDM